MVQPFDYTLGGVDPVAALQNGMAFGQQQRMGEQDMQIAASDEARAQEAFGMQRTMFDQSQADRAAAMEAQMAMNADLSALSERVAAGEVSSNDFAAIATKYPDMAEQLSGMWEGLATERKAADVAELFKGVTAIKAGRPDLAIQMLEDRAVAAENAGDKMEADIARATAAAIKADPAAGLTSLGLLLQVADPEAAKTVFGEAEAKPAGVVELEWRAQQAGLVPGTPEYQDFIARDGKPTAQPGTTTINADGSVVVSRDEPTSGGALKATRLAAQSAIDDIDAIMNDPALAKVTGSIQGGGGNDVDQFPAWKRLQYGDDGLGVIQRIYQAQNNNFLAARELLKGAGQVTDFEGRKAEAAMARLSRAQGDKEFKAALKDLRDAITEGVKKMEEAGLLEGADPSSPPPGAGEPSLEDLLREAEGLAP